MLFSLGRTTDGIAPLLEGPTETAVAALTDDMRKGAREAFTAYYRELAAEVKAQKIEFEKVSALLPPLQASVKAPLEAEAKALDQLHAALSPEQRQTLTKRQRERQAQMDERMASLTPDGKSNKLNHRSDPFHIDRLARELALTPEQRTAISAFALTDTSSEPSFSAKRREATEALLTAFEKPEFSARSTAAFQDEVLIARPRQDLEFLVKLVPQLTPEQATKLAERVERGWPTYERGVPYLAAPMTLNSAVRMMPPSGVRGRSIMAPKGDKLPQKAGAAPAEAAP